VPRVDRWNGFGRYVAPNARRCGGRGKGMVRYSQIRLAIFVKPLLTSPTCKLPPSTSCEQAFGKYKPSFTVSLKGGVSWGVHGHLLILLRFSVSLCLRVSVRTPRNNEQADERAFERSALRKATDTFPHPSPADSFTESQRHGDAHERDRNINRRRAAGRVNHLPL